VLANLFGETEQHPAALLGGGSGPRSILEGGLGGGDGTVHVVRVGVGRLRNDFFGRRIVDGESLGRFAIDPLSVNVELIGTDFGLHSAGHRTSCMNRITSELRSPP